MRESTDGTESIKRVAMWIGAKHHYNAWIYLMHFDCFIAPYKETETAHPHKKIK